MCEIYGPRVTSDGKVKQRCLEINEGHTSVHDEQWNGRPNVQMDERVEHMNQRIENQCFTFTEYSVHNCYLKSRLS